MHLPHFALSLWKLYCCKYVRLIVHLSIQIWSTYLPRWEHYKKIYYFQPFHFYKNSRKDCGFALYFLTCYMSGYQGDNIKHSHSWKLFQPRSTFWVSNILCSLAPEKNEKGRLSCVLQSCKRRDWCQRLHTNLSQSTDEKKNHQKENWLNHRVTWGGKNLQVQPST